jgi:hypothetical protein
MYFDGENISFDASLVIYINSTNIPPIMIINRIHENQNLLSLQLVSFLVGLRTYQHPCTYNTAQKVYPITICNRLYSSRVCNVIAIEFCDINDS